MGRPRKDINSDSSENTPKYIVKMAFKDSRDYQEGPEAKSYQVGEDVSHFEQARLDNAVALGIVEYTGETEQSESEA